MIGKYTAQCLLYRHIHCILSIARDGDPRRNHPSTWMYKGPVRGSTDTTTQDDAVRPQSDPWSEPSPAAPHIPHASSIKLLTKEQQEELERERAAVDITLTSLFIIIISVITAVTIIIIVV